MARKHKKDCEFCGFGVHNRKITISSNDKYIEAKFGEKFTPKNQLNAKEVKHEERFE